MKLVLGIVILIACTLLGYKLSKNYTDKKQFYMDFNEFNKRFKSEVQFSKKTIIEILKDYEDRNGEFFNAIKKYFLEEQTEEIKNKLFSSDDKSFLINYFNNLGDSDKFSQLNYIESVEKSIEDNFIKAEKEEKKYKTLYIKLGFLFGLIILIALL